MNEITTPEAREQIAKFLPNAIQTALKSYEEFLGTPKEEGSKIDPKTFKARHDACKGALSHLASLLDLYDALEKAHGPAQDPKLPIYIKAATEEIDRYDKNNS
ncbi:MAG: hypothetical protein L6Q57_02695 [Alphaproteobacteria bacterium]|nr:hypothetical protein [Alphaproteobacteria bacterium]